MPDFIMTADGYAIDTSFDGRFNTGSANLAFAKIYSNIYWYPWVDWFAEVMPEATFVDFHIDGHYIFSAIWPVCNQTILMLAHKDCVLTRLSTAHKAIPKLKQELGHA